MHLYEGSIAPLIDILYKYHLDYIITQFVNLFNRFFGKKPTSSGSVLTTNTKNKKNKLQCIETKDELIEYLHEHNFEFLLNDIKFDNQVSLLPWQWLYNNNNNNGLTLSDIKNNKNFSKYFVSFKQLRSLSPNTKEKQLSKN